MVMGKPNFNTFGTFLAAPAAALEATERAAVAPALSPQKPSADGSVRLLRRLAEGPSSPSELMIQTRMGVIELAESLKTLEGIALIKLSGPAEDQQVELTPAGKQLLPHIEADKVAG